MLLLLYAGHCAGLDVVVEWREPRGDRADEVKTCRIVRLKALPWKYCH